MKERYVLYTIWGVLAIGTFIRAAYVGDLILAGYVVGSSLVGLAAWSIVRLVARGR